MAWTPISGQPLQYKTSLNVLASGYYLKFYQAGTTTAFNMATDDTGGTTLDKSLLDSSGYPTTDGTTRFVPHVNQKYKIVLYKNETDADNNTTGNAEFVIDGIGQVQTGESDAWVLFNGTPTQASSTTFTVPGDYTETFYPSSEAGARVKLTDSSTLYDSVVSASYSSPDTTVTVKNGGLTGSLSTVYTSLISPLGNAVPIQSIVAIDTSVATQTIYDFENYIKDKPYTLVMFGVDPSDASTDYITQFKAALLATKARSAATSGNPVATLYLGSGYVKVSGALPVSARMSLQGDAYRGMVIRAAHTEAVLYSAEYSGGAFVDNLDAIFADGTYETKKQPDIILKDFSIDSDGDITGNSTDSGTAWSGVMHLVATTQLVIENVRTDSNGDNDTHLYIKYSYFLTLKRIVATCASNYRGGAGINLIDGCNNALLERCQIFGGFQYGYAITAETLGVDSVSLVECDAEKIDFEGSGLGDGGVGVGVWMGGTAIRRLSAIRLFGGYFENCDVEVQLGSDVNGAYCEFFQAIGTNHGQTSNSQHVFKIVNSVGHKIQLPRMANWDRKQLTLSGTSGMPADDLDAYENILTGVDRFGNTVKGIIDEWDSGTGEVIVKNLSGDLDPASAITFSGGGSGTLSAYEDFQPFGSTASETHFSIDNGGRVLGGEFDLTWANPMKFKPINVGLQNGTGIINLTGLDGNNVSLKCGQLVQDAKPIILPHFHNSTLTQTDVDTTGVLTHKVIIPAESDGTHVNIKMRVQLTCTLTSSPVGNNSTSFAEIDVNIVRAYSTNDAVFEAQLVQETFTNNGTGGDCAPIVASCITASGLTGSGELEIDLTFTTNAATDPNTTNILNVTGSLMRINEAQVYSAGITTS